MGKVLDKMKLNFEEKQQVVHDGLDGIVGGGAAIFS
jgi:hypothetical protein